MKILLATYSLSERAGSETFVMTMHDRLSKDHDVDVYVSSKGKNTLIDAGSDPNKHYDLALINHNVCLNELRAWHIAKRVFTSHGPSPALEQPIPGADVYVSVSEEVQKNLQAKGFESRVIRNPINTDHFGLSPVNGQLKNILFLFNHAFKPHISPLEKVKKACAGYEFDILSDFRPDVQEAISWADLVISAGRGCYEAMSCGKNVMIVNRPWFDGMVTQENIFELRKNNCSGRRFDLPGTVEDIKGEFRKYDPGRNMRPYILAHNNVDVIVGEYLRL